MAKPSSPSVRFTALDDAAITTETKIRKGTKANGQKCAECNNEWITRSGCTRFKNGIISSVEYALRVANVSRPMPTMELTKICSRNFLLLLRPRFCCLETL